MVMVQLLERHDDLYLLPTGIRWLCTCTSDASGCYGVESFEAFRAVDADGLVSHCGTAFITIRQSVAAC